MNPAPMHDGSWELRIFVTDLRVEKRLRVKGDMHIGGVILKLVEELGEYSPGLGDFSQPETLTKHSLRLTIFGMTLTHASRVPATRFHLW